MRYNKYMGRMPLVSPILDFSQVFCRILLRNPPRADVCQVLKASESSKNRVGPLQATLYGVPMSDYERIARVIRYLDAQHAERPSLEKLAAYAGVSPFHFHRLFTAWAGVTPKEFLQCLTLVHVKRLLREGQSVLEAAMAVGFSGPGRLHDLCIKFEAASPGELKAWGRDWRIPFGFTESPFGDCLMAEGPRGICHIAFGERANREEAIETLRKAWPAAVLHRDDCAIAQLAASVFQTASRITPRFPIRAMIRGSAFRVRVWKALLHVPPGSVVTYGKLAAAIGQPAAARAVGAAVGANSLAFLIPCHRVIRETGVIGEYRWGQLRKRVMIAWETAPRRELTQASVPWKSSSSAPPPVVLQ